MTKEYLLLWLKSAGIRALKTFAQTFIATIGTGAVVLGDVDWVLVLSSAALAAILSVATSVTGLPEVKSVLGKLSEAKQPKEQEQEEEQVELLDGIDEPIEGEQGK